MFITTSLFDVNLPSSAAITSINLNSDECANEAFGELDRWLGMGVSVSLASNEKVSLHWRAVPGKRLQSRIVNLISILSLFAFCRSINGVQSQLLTDVNATSQTTNERQLMSRSKFVNDSSMKPGVLDEPEVASGYFVQPNEDCSSVVSRRTTAIL